MLDLGSQKDTKYQVSRLSGREAGGRAGAVAVWGEEGEEEREKTTHNTQHALTNSQNPNQIKSNRQRPKSDDTVCERRKTKLCNHN